MSREIHSTNREAFQFLAERHYYDVPANEVRMPTFLRGIVIAALYVSTLVCLAARIRFRLIEISRIPRLETVQKLFLRWHIFLPSCSDEPLPKR